MSKYGSGAGQDDGRPHELRLTLTMDLDTHAVQIGGDPMPMSVAQMMLHEALEQLNIQRRAAAAAELRSRMMAEVQNAALRVELAKGGLQ
jgi:hypothetical protein